MGCGGCGHGENVNINLNPDEAFTIYQRAYQAQIREVTNARTLSGQMLADRIVQTCKPAFAIWQCAFDVYVTSGVDVTNYQTPDGTVLNALNVKTYFNSAANNEAPAREFLKYSTGDQLLIAYLVWQQSFEELRQIGILYQIITKSRPLK